MRGVCLLCLCLMLPNGFLYSQATTIVYGSTFLPEEPYPGLFFSDSFGNRFQTGNEAVLALGYFTETPGWQNFPDALASFNLIHEIPFGGNTTSPGYLTAATTASLDLSSTYPALLILAGVRGFEDAGSAGSIALVSDSEWSFLAPAIPNSITSLQTTIEPDRILFGQFIPVEDGFEIQTVPIGIPEPAHFTTVTVLLGFLVRTLLLPGKRQESPG